MSKRHMTEETVSDEIKSQPLPQLVEEVENPLLEKIGQALGGRHWQSDMARESGKSKSQITRFLNKERTPTVAFGLALNRILVDKIEDVTGFIQYKGAPNVDASNVAAGIKALRKGIALLRKTSPRVKRLTIAETSTRKHPPGKTKKNK